MVNLRDNVERWLIHENYPFKETKSKDSTFKIPFTDKIVGYYNYSKKIKNLIISSVKPDFFIASELK